jgi:large subunit ribosomal protein L22
MEIKASINDLRMSPRKVRLVIDLVRKMPVDKALAQLKFTNKKATDPVIKMIESAIANGVNTYGVDRNNLFIKEIRSDEGTTLKRWMPKAHGRATVLRKRGAHVQVTLGELVDSGKHEKKVVKAEAPVKLEDLSKEAEKQTVKAAKKTNKGTEGSSSVKSKAKTKSDAPEKGFASKVFNRKVGS